MSTKRNQRAAIQKNVKKSSADSQLADLNSVVFLVPVNFPNATNSTTVVTSLDGTSAAAPKHLSSSCPQLININGKNVYILPNNSALTANSCNIGVSNTATKSPLFVLNKGQLANSTPNIAASNPVIKSPLLLLNKGQMMNSSPIAAASPTATYGSMLSPKITGAALQPATFKECPVVNSIPVINTPAVLSPKANLKDFDEDPYLNTINCVVNASPDETKVNGFAFDLDFMDENSYSNAIGSLNTTASPVTSSRAGISPKVLGAVFNKSPNINSSPIVASSPTTSVRGVLSPKVNGSALEPNNGAIAENINKKPQCKRPADKAIATYVFFDLETTGLGHEIGKHNVQITEISMIAMRRKDFENSSSTELKDIRVIQKISLCTRPRSSVSYGAAEVTGLNDSNLLDQQPFDQNAASVITAFLNHLPKPVCLLAHNGAAYDFPLLKAELNRLSINLSSDILLGDTLKGFRELGVPVFPPEKKIPKSVKYGKRGISFALDNLHLYFFGKKPVGGHSSEGDCIALAKVCQGMKDLMLPWIDENCTTMDTVVPMW